MSAEPAPASKSASNPASEFPNVHEWNEEDDDESDDHKHDDKSESGHSSSEEDKQEPKQDEETKHEGPRVYKGKKDRKDFK